ncbi:MAG: M1 family aminopeptidase [bacterium]|nr:M1 family aminopeptidase [bacterium]
MKPLLILSLLCAAMTAVAAPRFPSPWDSNTSLPRPCQRPIAVALDEDPLHVYNALKCECRLSFDLDNTELAGYVLIQLTPTVPALDRVDFRFTHTLTVDSVWIASGTNAVSVTTEGTDSLQLWLTPAMGANDTITIGIAYHGDPASIDAWGGFRWASAAGWRPQIAFSMGDGFALDPPPSNYNWLPSYADPTDKVEWEAWFRVPENRVVSTGGVRLDTTHHGDGTVTWHYRLDRPVSTYLLFIAISDYVIQTQREQNPRIENFVYPSREAAAETHFSNVPAVLDGFASLFGPYPFERFGFCMTRLGDMEHATCVAHDDRVVSASHTYDWLLFHEMSHQWWGDWVTCGDWRDLWINEGFGTYCEALGMEILYGHESYNDYVAANLFGPARATGESFPIYNPDYYWGETVYEKGASVVHMLRCLLGDGAFFAAWREFGQEHAYGNAVTADWQAKLEQHYGESLDWFFQPWVYGVRYPEYVVTLDLGDIAILNIRQEQETGTFFRMPIDIRVFGENGDSCDVTIWNNATAEQIWDLYGLTGYEMWPASVRIDPDNKILKAVSYQILGVDNANLAVQPRLFQITSVFPNPFNPVAAIAFELPKLSPVTLRVFNLLGEEVHRRDVGTLPAGKHSLQWNGANQASGLYVFRLETPGDSRTAKALLLK